MRNRAGPAAATAAPEGIAAQMDAIRAAGQRHVQPIVDDDARRRAVRDRDEPGDQVDELGGFESRSRT